MSLAGWQEFAFALSVFTASHFLPRWRGLRDVIIGKIGRRPYFAGYGAVSVLVLSWLIGSAGRAPYVELWSASHWMRQVPSIVMPLAIFLSAIGFRTRSPYTLGSNIGSTMDPANPGLAALTRHPVLWGLVLWSASHLPPNGDLAHVILFSGFAAMSLLAMILFDQRARTALSLEARTRLFQSTPLLSPTVILKPRWLMANARSLIWYLIVAALIWAVALGLHTTVIGVSPLA